MAGLCVSVYAWGGGGGVVNLLDALLSKSNVIFILLNFPTIFPDEKLIEYYSPFFSAADFWGQFVDKTVLLCDGNMVLV